ncbi:MAG: autotransporter-associated beta strand repeat-containing protein [Verrucomicrobiaceae bacterium]|nr:autotransporter-associated beta strand repeat-containing protein [Verrucomicrobiaceae bacterium]
MIALLLPSIGTAQLVPGSNGDWNANANGNWSTGPWTALDVGTDYPSGVGARALVIQNITGTRTITLDVDPTLGTLVLGDTNNTNAFVIGSAVGAGTLTFDNGGAANADNAGVLGAFFNHNSGTTGLSPNGGDRIDSNVSIADTVGLTIDADRNLEFQGSWTGNGTNSITLINSNAASRLNDPRFYWDASGSNIGVLSGIDTLNIINGEARFDGVAGTANSQLIGATTINLGNGALQSDSDVFPRLFLVNVETTQTATLNVNGGWLVSDLGTIDDLEIWSGNINFTGAATTNIFDVNDAGAADTHIVTGSIGGTGGFSKVNIGALQLTADNSLQGNIYIQRGGVGGTGLASEGSIRLTGAAGAFSGLNSVVLSRDGSLYFDNSIDINADRFRDAADVEIRAAGRLRMIGNATGATSETLGALTQTNGSGKVNFDLDDTTPQLTTLSFASYTRAPGSITQFQVLENTPGEFGSQLAGRAQLFIADGGTTAIQKGGGGADLSTNKSLVLGAYGGVNNISNHFMTFDEDNPTELRPLTWDGTQAGSEYFLSRDSLTPPHQFTQAGLGALDQNVNINFNTAVDGDISQDPLGYGWYGAAPIAILEDVAMNSLRFGTNTPTNGTNNNEIGSALVLAPGAHLYLGDSLAANTGLSGDTDGSGMILFGRDVFGSSPGSSQYIAGGILDFGSREAIIVNESGNSALFRSEIRGTGGLTKAGAQTIYLDNSNSYSGVTTIAEGILDVRDQNGLGASNLVVIEGSGQLYLELGSNIINTTASPTPPNLLIGVTDASRTILYSNAANNTWGGDLIIDNVDNLGNWVYSSYIGTNARDTLNINGNIYTNELVNPINTDIVLNDSRLITTQATNLAGGIINLNGQVRDNALGAITSPVTNDNENQLMRFWVRGSNELVVNARQQWDAAGLIRVENGVLRYEGDGNFWTAAAEAAINPANSQSGMTLGGSGAGTGISGSNNNTGNNAVILTKAGQVLNIGRIDIGGDGTNNLNGKGNSMLAGTNSSGTVTFGNGTDRVVFNGSNSANAFVRDLTVYQAAGGTMDLNFRLDDTDVDSHTSFTKVGRGVVNYNSAGTANGDVEQLNMSGGLLRLTNYGVATGTRFDNGAMIILAGGGIEMDAVGSIANETANYTGAAVVVNPAFPTAATVVAPGGTDVIVTSDAGRTTTMNIGSVTIPLPRFSGGTVNFVENANGGTSAITLMGSDAPVDGTAIAWATYGDTYNYNAATATYTLNALDFAMTTAGALDAFSGTTREDTDDVSTWTGSNDVSEGLLGFTGTTGVGTLVNTIHFDYDGSGTITVDAGGLEVTSGGIMVSSLVATDTSAKLIAGGPLTAGADEDLIVHQYGASTLTIDSIIADNAGSTAGNALVKTGAGVLELTGANTYTGRTFLNGGTLRISSDGNLGTAPVSPVVDGIYINGGIIDTTADLTIDANRGITLGGNGGEINVDAATTLTYGGVIASEPNVIAGYTANPAVGRIDKTGAGTLLLTNINNSYTGLTEVKEGTLLWAPTFTSGNTSSVFGSNGAFLDGTVIRSGATLAMAPSTPTNVSNFNAVFQEWFTFEGGSTVNLNPGNSAGDPHDINFYFRGVLQFDSLGNPGTPDGFQTPSSIAGATVLDIGSQGSTNLNDDGGYITGDGGITKIGPGALVFRENSPEWTGQLIILQGQVLANSAGNPLGTGTMPIIMGHNLFGEQAGEPDSGNTQVQLLFQDEGGYRDVSSITQDIIIRADDGAGSQTKRLGAQNLANVDVVNFDGSITMRDDVELFYTDSARDSTQTTTNNINNSGRSIGTLTNTETYFINFNGNIIGAVGNDLTTNVSQGGTANVANGSITAPFDDLVERAIFGLNGDNSGWAGKLTLGNASSDVDTNHIVSFGNPLAISANNDVTIRNNATLQTSGHAIVLGNLTGTGSTENYIENASTSPGSITITQTTDQTVDVVIRDGVNFFELLPGEVDAALSFTKAGPAALTLTKGNTFSGSTTLSGGTLRLAYDADNSMLSDTAELILNDGIIDLAGTVSHSEVVLSTTINGTVAIERSAGSSILNLNTITRNAGSLRISEDDITTTDNANVNGILGGWATVGGSFATNSGVLDPGTNGGYIRGLATFDQNIDRLSGGAGTQLIVDGVTDNVNIQEAGTTVGPITLAAAGTTTIYTLRQGADGSTVDGPDGPAVIDIGVGNTLRIASGGVLLPDTSSPLTFNQTGSLTAGATDNTAATLFVQNQSTAGSLLTVGTVISDNGSGIVDVRTTGPGTTVFTGANTYTGNTLVGSGILAIGDGGSTGTLSSGDVNVEASAVLAFNRSDTALAVPGAITGTGNVAQNGSGTTTLSGAAPLSSLTFTLADGTLATGVDGAIHTTGTLVFGGSAGATTIGTLDLTNGDAIVGGLLVQTNTTAENQLIIGTGKTLTVNGGVTVGVNANSSATKLAASGGGSLVVNSSGADFVVGGATGSTNENNATLDMSGLDTFTADLGAGTFRVGDANTGTTANPSAATLASNNTITAGSIRIGDGAGGTSLHTLTLGDGANIFNSDVINIGSAVNRNRSSGEMLFAGTDSTGTLTIRALDGTGRALLNMVNTSGSTSSSMSSTIDLSGHTADVAVSALTMAARTANTGSATATLTFNQGTLDVLTLDMANRGGGAGTATATLNLGDSAAPSTPTTTIGSITMASNTSSAAAPTVTANINVTGGDVTIGTGSGTAINMANAITSRSADSFITMSGGNTTVTGSIIRTGGGGTENAVITLDGGSFDMSGNQIGDAANPINLLPVSGTISNLGELNGGGAFTKNAFGTLTINGTNTYTGATNVVDGRVEVVGTILGTGTVTTAGASTILAAAPVLAGGSPTATIAGTTIIGTGPAAQGILAPGIGDSSTSNQQLTFTNAGGITVASGSQIQLSITNPTVAAGNTAVDSWISSGQVLSTYLGSNPGDLTTFNAAPATYGDMDYLNLATGGLTLGTRAGPTVGEGSLWIQDNGFLGGTPAIGDVFNLIDWAVALAGTFDVPGDYSSGGAFGDLDLPDLDPSLSWDVSAFKSHGIIAVTGVVPEPSRMLLMFVGLVLVTFRRRRPWFGSGLSSPVATP